jgi:hypothetical protein
MKLPNLFSYIELVGRRYLNPENVTINLRARKKEQGLVKLSITHRFGYKIPFRHHPIKAFENLFNPAQSQRAHPHH